MSIFVDASVSIIIADYIAAGPDGKLTVVGGGITYLGLQPDGACLPHHVAVWVDYPSKYAGQQFALGVSLWDVGSNVPVQVPSGPAGQFDALRVVQTVMVELPHLPGFVLPRDMPLRSNVALAFPNGLPLPPGQHYAWRVDIDGQRKKPWRSDFTVLAPPVPPVVGGPANSPDIAGLGEDEMDEEPEA